MLGKWFNTFFKPQTLDSEIDKGSIGKAVKNVAIAGIIAGLIMGIGITILSALAFPILFFLPFPLFGGFGGIAFLSSILVFFVSSIITLLIASVILLIFAKLFKGTGSFENQTYLLSLPTSAAILISGIVVWIPIVGQVIAGIVSIYYFYPLTKVLKIVHNYETWKAVLTWFIPTVISIVITVAPMILIFI